MARAKGVVQRRRRPTACQPVELDRIIGSDLREHGAPKQAFL